MIVGRCERTACIHRREAVGTQAILCTMYASFFGLKQEPFSIAPDPRYLFMSERHREALAHLLYGLGGGGGFVLLTGEIGAGKTTVCRCFLEQIPRRCNVAYIFNPKLTVNELLKSVCDEFRIPYRESGTEPLTVKDYIDPLNEYLLRTHAVSQDNVLIIDEAQNLSADVLEQLRLLTNLETNERKLLQIVLIGQPELRQLLAKPELEQLAQRVLARFHLEALSEVETRQYIAHRLGIAGLTTALPFSRKALVRIHQVSRGVPRRINLLCDRAMLGAYGSGISRVDTEVVDKAAEEVFGKSTWARPNAVARSRAWLIGGGVLAGVALGGAIALGLQAGSRPNAPMLALAASSPSGASAAKTAVGAAARAASAAPGATLDAAAEAPSAASFSQRYPDAARDERVAWRALARAWKVTLTGADPCAAAETQALSCFRGNSSTLAMIRQLGRPGIVSLRDDAGAPVYALLIGLSQQSATLRFGTATETVPIQSLARLWRGDFSTLWRVPPGYQQHRIVNADSGPAADWLAEHLAKLDGRATPSDPAAFKASVAAFQLAQGLKADGLAGPTTFMQLNRVIGVDEPRLLSSAN